MVVSYLEKLKSEYMQDKLNAEKELSDLQIHLRENIEFIKLLEESNDPNYEALTPREVNPKNKSKILELKQEQKEIQNAIDKQKIYKSECEQRLEELMAVLSEAKKEIVGKNHENVMMDESYRITLLETQENERQRISRELHDYTVQNLTSLVHKTELCSKLVEMDPVRCKLELSMMSKTLRDIINDTRQLIYNLRPMSFDDIGLDVTVERALEKIESSESKKINFKVEGEPYQIKPVIGLTLLRIIQEGCSNAIRHASATYVQVVLTYHPEMISVTIEDDGKGFDANHISTESREDNSGFGLSMMKERVYLLSGNIEIESKIGTGTRIIVNVPIKNKEEN